MSCRSAIGVAGTGKEEMGEPYDRPTIAVQLTEALFTYLVVASLNPSSHGRERRVGVP